MAQLKVNPTRMELKKIQNRYVTARKGHKLLKDKRDELMRQFLDVVGEDKVLREKVEKALSHVYGSFSVAGAVSNPSMLEEALICPKRVCELKVTEKNVMSVIVPSFEIQVTDNGADSSNYGFAFTSGELDAAVEELGTIQTDLIRLAELEKTVSLLAEEIERTRRRVNALEYIMIPQYIETIKAIKMKLDENERGNTTRLMKVKDMMLQQQLAMKKAEEDEEFDPSEE